MIQTGNNTDKRFKRKTSDYHKAKRRWANNHISSSGESEFRVTGKEQRLKCRYRKNRVKEWLQRKFEDIGEELS